MTRRNNRGSSAKNKIQNVRVVDKDEGSDDIICQRIVQQYNTSEGQIRVLCNLHQEYATSATANVTGTVDYTTVTATDDFQSFAAQYMEFRVKAIRFDIYDINPSSLPVVNYWSTFHNIGGASIPVDVESVLDRPDSRSISPGDGRASLAWVAHGVPEMAFQPTNGYQNLGGLSFFISTTTAQINPKYALAIKFVVDFRGRK
jgi:hypothetical protein